MCNLNVNWMFKKPRLKKFPWGKVPLFEVISTYAVMHGIGQRQRPGRGGWGSPISWGWGFDNRLHVLSVRFPLSILKRLKILDDSDASFYFSVWSMGETITRSIWSSKNTRMVARNNNVWKTKSLWFWCRGILEIFWWWFRLVVARSHVNEFDEPKN